MSKARRNANNKQRISYTHSIRHSRKLVNQSFGIYIEIKYYLLLTAQQVQPRKNVECEMYTQSIDGHHEGRATFSERGPDETFRSSSWAGVTNENPKMKMYIITILLLQNRQISATAGAGYREVFQCQARWMSSTTEECH